MRYYELTITNPVSGQNYLLDPKGLGFIMGTGPLATSLYNSQTTSNAQLIGKTNPNALNVEMDLPIAPMHLLQSDGGFLRLWGIGVRALAHASDLNPTPDGAGALQFKTFTLRGGMAKGLPLANPAQAGLLASGIVYQSFGNWTGTEQTLDLVLQTGSTNPQVPISWSWPKGTNLKSALALMFKQAFPSYTPNIQIGANLVAASDQVGIYLKTQAFFSHLRSYTAWLGAKTYGPSYQGVYGSIVGQTINAIDQAADRHTVALAFQDLIGQPTWIEAFRITFQTTLRGDINLFDYVQFPTSVMSPYRLTSPAAAAPNAPASSSSNFQGKYQVQEIHHFANFREPNAVSWNTTFVAVAIPTALSRAEPLR